MQQLKSDAAAATADLDAAAANPKSDAAAAEYAADLDAAAAKYVAATATPTTIATANSDAAAQI